MVLNMIITGGQLKCIDMIVMWIWSLTKHAGNILLTIETQGLPEICRET